MVAELLWQSPLPVQLGGSVRGGKEAWRHCKLQRCTAMGLAPRHWKWQFGCKSAPVSQPLLAVDPFEAAQPPPRPN
jgi:hypothetical protein